MGQETVSRAFSRIAKSAGLSRHSTARYAQKCDLMASRARTCYARSSRRDPAPWAKGVTGTHYNFALYEGQVRKALQVWADQWIMSVGELARRGGRRWCSSAGKAHETFFFGTSANVASW